MHLITIPIRQYHDIFNDVTHTARVDQQASCSAWNRAVDILSKFRETENPFPEEELTWGISCFVILQC